MARATLLDAALTGLDRVGVRWALLRGRADLGSPGGDVDLLVSAADLDSFDDVVLELGAFRLPRLRTPGSWSRAVLRHPWHRFYVLTDPSSGASVKLDVVTQLVYGRQARLESGLEGGCLERRVVDDGVQVLDPTDMFWTVLLHCLLDKQKVTPHRAAELGSVVDRLRRPSAGEDFVATLLPPGRSVDEVVAWVRAGRWRELADLGRSVLGLPAREAGTGEAGAGEPGAGGPGTGGAAAPPRPAGRERPRGGTGGRVGRRLHGALRSAAVSVYPALWRRAGLGTVPRVLDLMEVAHLDVTVLALRRRPGRCDVVVLTTDGLQDRAVAALRDGGYRAAAGGWHRLSGTGVERVRLVTAGQLALSEEEARALRSSSRPIADRTHCRRAAGTAPRLDG